MAAPIGTPGALSAYGIGKEGATTPGTAVAAVRWLPFAAFDPQDVPTILEDDGMRGSMVTDVDSVVGPIHTEGTFSGPFSPEGTGDLLLNTLGAIAAGAPVSSVYPHTASLLNSGTAQPPTSTFTDYQRLTASTSARQYPYSCLSELTFSGNFEGLCRIAGKFSGFPSAAAGVTPTNAPTADQVIPAWRSSLTIGGVAAPNLIEWTITIARTVLVQPATDGTQSPYTIARGPISVSGKYSFVALDESPLTSSLAGTKSAHVLTIDNGLATTANRGLTLTMTKAMFKQPQQKRDTILGWDVNFTAYANSTDAGASGGISPLKAVLKSAIVDYTV